MLTKRTTALTTRLEGRDIVLTCRCGFTIRRELRAYIEAQCPKCGREWRR